MNMPDIPLNRILDILRGQVHEDYKDDALFADQVVAEYESMPNTRVGDLFQLTRIVKKLQQGARDASSN